MADEWQELTDPGSGRKYYYNAATKVTSWEVPAGFKSAAAAAAPAAASGWQELTDPSSGRKYYYNAATNTTSWEMPAGFSSGAGAGAGAGSDGAASARKSTILAKRGAIAKRKTAAPQTVAEKLASRAKKFVQLRKTEKAKTQPSAFARKRTAGLVKGGGAAAAAAAPAAASAWQAVTHPETGQTYYYNATTGETSWTLPS